MTFYQSAMFFCLLVVLENLEIIITQSHYLNPLVLSLGCNAYCDKS